MSIHNPKTSPVRNLLGAGLFATAALTISACAVEDGGLDDVNESDDPIAAFSKDIVISDGANTVVLTALADDAALLENYNDDSYEIVPIFERPAVVDSGTASFEISEGDDGIERDIAVTLQESFAELEDGAIGYSLRYVGVAAAALSQCSSANVHTSTRDNASVTVTSGTCTEAKISTKRFSWSWYAQKAYASSLCPAAQALTGGQNNSNRVKIQICPGPGYTYSFFN